MKVARENLPEEFIRRRTPRGAILEEPRAKQGSAIWCSVCELVSFHPSDVTAQFCACCHVFHKDAPDPKWMKDTDA